jgi:hypothetical protein
LQFDVTYISQWRRDATTEGIEKVVLTVSSLIAHAKVLDLIEQMVSSVPLIDD